MSVYRDFNFKFEKSLYKDNKILEDHIAIKQSLMNIIMTSKGEVVFDPEFGSNLRKLLFEKISPITELRLREEIRVIIENYEPRINITDIVFVGNPDYHIYEVYIKYIINVLNIEDELNVTLDLKGI